MSSATGLIVPSAFETCASATILRPLAEQLLERRDVERAVVANRRHDEPRARPLAEQLPRHDVRMVLEPRDQHLVARVEALAEARRDQIDRLRRAAREHDFRGRRGVDEASDLCARALVGRRGALAQLVHAAMHVRVVQALLQRHRVVNRRRRLARRRVVEIGQRFAVDELLQRRKVSAKRREIAASAGGRSVLPSATVIAPSSVSSRAVTRSSAWLRRLSSAICSTTVAANAVVSTRRAVGRVEPAGAQIEQLLGVELADGRAVAALDVVGVDLELGLRVDLRVVAEQQVVVASAARRCVGSRARRRPCR